MKNAPRVLLGALLLASGVASAQSTAPAQPLPTAPKPAIRPPGMSERMVLTLERAIEIAMQRQPALRQSRASVEAAQGRVDQARVSRRPTVNINGSVNVGSSRSGFCQPVDGGGIPVTCGGFFSPQTNTSIGASIQWRLYDFGQTAAQIRAAEASAAASEASVESNALDVRTSVEVAFLEAVARQQLVEVAEATVQSETLHVEQAQKFVAAQAKDPIEVVQSQARLANARSALAQAQTAQAIALANLRAAIGWVDPTRTPVVASEWPTPPVAEPPSLPELVEAARKNRPDIAALDKQIAAAEASYDAAAAGRRPVLSASASTQWNPSSTDWDPEPSWSAGLSLSWSLYDAGRASADKRIARANVISAEAQRDALLVNLTSDLEQARSQIIANRANVEASTEAVEAARQQLKLAEARYAAGLGSQIELTDAQFAVTTASGNLIQAEWQLASAWARLRRAVGQL
jgi:outer membrane protein